MSPLLRLLLPTVLLFTPALLRAQAGPFPEFYAKAMADLAAAKEPYQRWCALGRAAKESFNQGHDEEAKAFAEELEQLAPKYEKDWNYGNALQDFNLVLGRLALRTDDVNAAAVRLLAAGHSPGSPQMNTFGPNMALARDLLLRGEKAVVLQYFELCRGFWQLHHGKLDAWRKDVEEGRIPEFGGNLLY
jgi:hypothetical protein